MIPFKWTRILTIAALFALGPVLAGPSHAAESSTGELLRLGLLGLDTSHVIAFTRILNDPGNPEHVPGARIVAGYPGGSPDLPASADRLEGFTRELREKWGVEIVPDIAELCRRVDGVLLTSVDGRPHLRQARAVIEAGLPLFIDKPIAASLADVIEIAKLARRHNVPWFGGSSLRWYAPLREALAPERIGQVLGCDAYSPCTLEPHHPDLFWYGVHGVELLYTAMGPGCRTVARTSTRDTDVVVGVWEDGRVGVFRGNRGGRHAFGATIFGSRGNRSVEGHNYQGVMEAVVRFFQTRQPPIPVEEMVEIYAFMEAADESKRQGGAAVRLPEYSLE